MEEMTLGPDGITTGASNDIERATKMARAMVTGGQSENWDHLCTMRKTKRYFWGCLQGLRDARVG